MLNIELFDSIAARIKLRANFLGKDLNGVVTEYHMIGYSYYPPNTSFNTLEHIKDDGSGSIVKHNNKITVMVDYVKDLPTAEGRKLLLETYNSIMAET